MKITWIRKDTGRMKRMLLDLWIKIIVWARKCCPPGFRADKEISMMLLSWLVAVVFSLITFGYGFIDDCQRISSYNYFLQNEAPIMLTQHPVIQNDAINITQMIEKDMHMTPFLDLVSGTILWFLLSGVLVSVTYIIAHYMYYRSETKSIYLMVRLNSNRLNESYFKLPVYCFLIHILTCLVLLLVYFISYRIAIGILF